MITLENKEIKTNVNCNVNVGANRYDLNFQFSEKNLNKLTASVFNDGNYKGTMNFNENGGMTTSLNETADAITHLTNFLAIVSEVKKEVGNGDIAKNATTGKEAVW